MAALLSSIALFPCQAHAAGELQAELNEARDLVGIDLARARATIAALRERAIGEAWLGARLEADELDCTMLREADMASASRVASSGLAATAAAVASAPDTFSAQPRVKRGAMRLRVCAAGSLIDGGQIAAGKAQLETILAETADDPDLASAHALALVERGLQRSTAGELVTAQSDLLEACRSLDALGQPRDTETCLSDLATHYIRMGDLDEARALFVQLLDTARQRGANIDVSMRVYDLARVDVALQAWMPALASYREALQMSETLSDEPGIVYAEQGVGGMLIKLDRPAEALPHIQRALKLLAGSDDRKIILRCKLWLASAWVALGQVNEAADALRQTEVEVRAGKNDLLISEWLANQRQVQVALGHWHDAYDAAEALRNIEGRMQAQRMSEQTARLRMRFNREKDASDLRALQQVNSQGQELRRLQALALALFGGLLLVLLVYAHYKFRQGRRLKALALNDELTGLANRRAVLAQSEVMLRRAQRHGQRLGILMIDVDRFKTINDTHGHAVGDEVLRHLAKRLTASLRAHDCLGRLGGEEFLVVLPDVQPGTAEGIAERMRHSVADAPCECSIGPVSFTISIGVAETLTDTQTVAALIERSDAALYAAKAGGRNAVVLAEALATPA